MKKREQQPGSEGERRLVRRAQAGDLIAEEELLRRYKGLARVKANMYFMVGADEDDVLQEGMIGLLKAVRRYNPKKEASFSTFAGLCITNEIISAIRAADRNKHRILNTSLSLDETVSGGRRDASGGEIRLGDTLEDSSAQSPEQLLVIKDIAECIVHNDDRIFSSYEMNALTELLRGKSRQEIADELGRTVKSVDNCLNRVRKKILEYLST
ncbi:MAG: sigma-70 family RNA polymerase sigma factor [Bacillota bacterium]|nr:sigma-70 family RNA polymerase sigma factor [Bacillota bacterium]